VNDVAPRDRDVAMVFQNYALYPHMTVFENLAFGLKLRKVPREEQRRRVQAAAAMLGLERYLERRPRELSGGERQRVALGRALVRRPRLFLFDEPLSNLDAKLRTHMRAEIARIHHRLATTMIYVTHDQVEAMTLGERIAVLKDGHLQQVADPLTLYRHPINRFVAGFIGSPAMNFLSAQVAEGGSRLTLAEETLAVADGVRSRISGWEGRRVTLGVRPEDWSVEGGTQATPTSLGGRVAVREPLGAEVLVHCDTSVGPVVVRVTRGDPPAVDDPVRLTPDLARAHFFDPESEASLDGV